jgi:hypothetical protein
MAFGARAAEKFVRSPSSGLPPSSTSQPLYFQTDCLAQEEHIRQLSTTAILAVDCGKPGHTLCSRGCYSKADEVKSQSSVCLGPVALQILSYLRTHQNAQDTVEGIAEWWLLEQHVRYLRGQVKQALAELVAQRMVLERTGRDGRVHYRLHPRRIRAVSRVLELPVHNRSSHGGRQVVQEKIIRPESFREHGSKLQ